MLIGKIRLPDQEHSHDAVRKAPLRHKKTSAACCPAEVWLCGKKYCGSDFYFISSPLNLSATFMCAPLPAWKKRYAGVCGL